MTSDLPIELVDDPSPEDMQQVIRGLVGHNVQHVGPEDWRRLAAFVRGSDGAVVGGIVGEKHWNWLFVSHLWLRDELRGHGLGRELVAQIEAKAVQIGCNAIQLDTYDFQGLPFYRHLGYQPFGKLSDCPTGHTRYFLSKSLATNGPPSLAR